MNRLLEDYVAYFERFQPYYEVNHSFIETNTLDEDMLSEKIKDLEAAIIKKIDVSEFE